MFGRLYEAERAEVGAVCAAALAEAAAAAAATAAAKAKTAAAVAAAGTFSTSAPLYANLAALDAAKAATFAASLAAGARYRPITARRTELHLRTGGAPGDVRLVEHPHAARRSHLLVAAYLPSETDTQQPANVGLVARRLYAFLRVEPGFRAAAAAHERGLAGALAQVSGHRYAFGEGEVMQAFHLHWPQPAPASGEHLPAYA